MKRTLVLTLTAALGVAVSARATDLAGLRARHPERRHQFAATGLGTTHFQDTGGQGPVVVLVHGVSGPMAVWDHQVPYLTGRGYRVIRYDLYGRGMSDRVAGATTLPAYLRQLEDLLAARGVDRAHFVGSSFGAVIVSELALRHPERAASLTLVGPGGFPVRAPWAARLKDIPLLGRAVSRVFGAKAIRDQNHAYFVAGKMPAELGRYFDAQLAVGGTREAIVGTLANPELQGYASGYEKLGRLGVSVNVIWGRRDVTFPHALSARLLRLVPGARLVTLESAAHLPQYERFDVVNRHLGEMLAAPVARPGVSPRVFHRGLPETTIEPGLVDNAARFDDAFFAKFPRVGYPLELEPGLVKPYRFPTLYRDVTMSAVMVTVDYGAARKLVGDPELEPVLLAPGRAALFLSSYRYTEAEGLQPYHEVAITVPVRLRQKLDIPFVALLNPERFGVAARVVAMPVTSRENRIRGHAIWGLPKEVYRISLGEVGDSFVTEVFDARDRLVVQFAVPLRGDGKRERIDQRIPLFSTKAGVALEAMAESTGEFFVREDKRALAGLGSGVPAVVWGDSPDAARFRALGMDPVAFRTQFGDNVRSAFGLPRARRKN